VADAHEFLQSECEAVWRRRPAVSDEDLYQHFVRKFGPPDDVAAAYAFASERAEEGGPADDGRHAALDGRVSAAGLSKTPRPKSRVRIVLMGLGLVLVAVGLVAWSANSGLLKVAAGSVPQEKLSWADRVVSFTPGDPRSPISNDPAASLGAPDCQNPDSDVDSYISLGTGGELVLEFTTVWFCDGVGPDLKIIEIGPLAEPFDVAVSRDGQTWIDVGRAKGADSAIDLAPFVRPGDRFRYVRLVDCKSTSNGGNSWPGADIDAVGVLHIFAAKP
jgi:hypothetical protein